MDTVVIGAIIALSGTVIVFGCLAYRFFKIICAKDDSE